MRPVTMTALAAFFALIPGALALERGSEANAPLARAILGGLLAVEPATLFVLPCLYSLLVRDKVGTHARGVHPQGEEGEEGMRVESSGTMSLGMLMKAQGTPTDPDVRQAA